MYTNPFETNFNIYGDDFKVNIIPKNTYGNCVLSISDYDKDQKLESEININFSKDELSQFINLLKAIYSEM